MPAADRTRLLRIVACVAFAAAVVVAALDGPTPLRQAFIATGLFFLAASTL